MNHSGIVTGISYTGETTYRCENCAKKDAEIAELKARNKELDDALTDSQAHLAWAEQDSKALSELRLQLANEQTGNAELKAKLAAESDKLGEKLRGNMPKNVHNIVYDYLKANGFDGLYNPDADPGCACRVDKNDEFMVCDIVNEDTCYFCIPGYLTPCDPETCGEHKFHITVNKPQKAKRELLKGE